MKKVFFVLFYLVFISLSAFSTVSISTFVVDGIWNNENVIIHNRVPIFTWEYSGTISSFTINISSESYLVDNSTCAMWFIQETTSSEKVSLINLGSGNFRASISYNSDNKAKDLFINTTYYWKFTAFGENIESLQGKFITIMSSITLKGTKYDLKIDWNNPFNPLLSGESGKTKFRYILKGEDIKKNIVIKIYNIIGEYIATAKHFAPQEGEYYQAISNIEYTAEWDGRDWQGNLVPSGIYFVNLEIEGESKGVTRRVVVKYK